MTQPEKSGSRVRERVWTVFFTLLVTAVFGSGVSFVHVMTQDRIRENEKLFLRRALRAAAALPILPDGQLPEWFASSVTESGPMHYVVRGVAGDTPAHVFLRSGAGLWGQIRAAVGIAVADDEVQPFLLGAAFLEQNETPGLGARIAEPWFAAQLRGKRGVLRLVPETTRSESANEIDAITGATVTSTAVRDILNRVLSEDAAMLPHPERSAPDGQAERP